MLRLRYMRCTGPGGTIRVASRPARAEPTATNMAVAGALADRTVRGDESRGYDGQAERRAALPGGGQ